MIYLASSYGTHPTIGSGCDVGPVALCQFNYDSLISSAVAIALTLAIAFWVRSQLRSGHPSKVQAIFELGYDAVRGLVKDIVAEDATFIIPLAMTLFLYIFIANYIELLPLAVVPNDLLHGANADWNQTLAMGLVVIVVVQWYSFHVLGVKGYFLRYTKPFELPLPARILFIPLNIIEEVVKPITLSLRLFGNIFAGAVMIALIAGLGALSLPLAAQIPLTIGGGALLVLWKVFDVMFIGLLQAFIFMLLTIIYFGAAREGLEHIKHEEHH